MSPRSAVRECMMAGTGVWCGPGGYTGWVIPRSHPSGTLKSPPQHLPAKRAPEAPQGLEWVGRCVRGWAGPVPPFGPGRSHPVGPPCTGPLNARLLANKARIKVKTSKVSQNHGVSPVYVEKACHSPYIQNACQKSPLDILRFPIPLAFSPKELMVPF